MLTTVMARDRTRAPAGVPGPVRPWPLPGRVRPPGFFFSLLNSLGGSSVPHFFWADAGLRGFVRSRNAPADQSEGGPNAPPRAANRPSTAQMRTNAQADSSRTPA